MVFLQKNDYMGSIITNLKWKYYYRYKQTLCDEDFDGKYSFIQKCLLFLNITKVNFFGEYLTPNLLKDRVETSPEKVSDIIFNILSSDKPCMIARYGSNEQRIVANYLSIKSRKRSALRAIWGKQPFWWWNKYVRKNFTCNAGFFPDNISYIEKYSERMINDSEFLDVLLTWFGWESLLINPDSDKIALVGLWEAEPWWQNNPWTRFLEGKRVLVVHPFAELIQQQYVKRRFLFENRLVLPDFELKTLKAVQSIGGRVDGFTDWFDALRWMENEMDKIDYDIALIGCGAYGFCLAAHAKRCGKKAIHLGGVLQLLFGIKGNRWENKNYHSIYDYSSLFNNHWVKPDMSLRPHNAEQIEDACYW